MKNMKYIIIILLVLFLNSCYLSRDARYFRIKNKKITSINKNDINLRLYLGGNDEIPFYKYPSNKLLLRIYIPVTKNNNISDIESVSDIKIKIEYDSVITIDNASYLYVFYKKHGKHNIYDFKNNVIETITGGREWIYKETKADSSKIIDGFKNNTIESIDFDQWVELKYIPEELNFTIIIKDKEYKFEKLRKFEFYSFKIYHI